MKVLSFILSIYFLWLSTISCSENSVHSKDTCQSVTCSQIVSGDNGDNCENDFCSPFCTCSCCHGFTLLSYFNNKIILSIESPSLRLYTESPLQGVSQSVWQPPKYC